MSLVVLPKDDWKIYRIDADKSEKSIHKKNHISSSKWLMEDRGIDRQIF